MSAPTHHSQRVPPGELSWRVTLVALLISVAGTAILGGALFRLRGDVWWLAIGSVPSLLGAGIYLGWRSREPEPLYGALLALLYFGLVVGFLFSMEAAEALPDPVPGLAIGDSTFFFVSPLIMLATGVVGTVVGGQLSRRRKHVDDQSGGKGRV